MLGKAFLSFSQGTSSSPTETCRMLSPLFISYVMMYLPFLSLHEDLIQTPLSPFFIFDPFFHTDSESMSESSHTDSESASESSHTDSEVASESSHTDIESVSESVRLAEKMSVCE